MLNMIAGAIAGNCYSGIQHIQQITEDDSLND